MLLDKANRLKIIFLTDIHFNHKGIDKLEEWINENYITQPHFDYCFIGGDSATCDYDKNSHDEQQMYNGTLELMKRIKNIVACKLLLIPGNHDCKQFFKNQALKNQPFINIHNKVVQLSEGLSIAGFGGSVPAYSSSQRGAKNGELHWKGYPYDNEKDLQKQWSQGSQAKYFQQNSNTNQLIMLTHIGPQLSETATDSKDLFPNGYVSTGSYFLNQFATRKQIVCWFHGHTHAGSKLSRFGDLLIMNPGAIKCNQFMHFELYKEENIWKLGTKVFQTL